MNVRFAIKCTCPSYGLFDMYKVYTKNINMNCWSTIKENIGFDDPNNIIYYFIKYNGSQFYNHSKKEITSIQNNLSKKETQTIQKESSQTMLIQNGLQKEGDKTTLIQNEGNQTMLIPVSYTHLTLPTTPYV